MEYCDLQPSGGFSIDFLCQKLAGKVTHGYQVTAGHYKCCKCEPVAKQPGSQSCDHKDAVTV